MLASTEFSSNRSKKQPVSLDYQSRFFFVFAYLGHGIVYHKKKVGFGLKLIFLG